MNRFRPLWRRGCAPLVQAGAVLVFGQAIAAAPLVLNEREYFSTRGLDVLAFSNWYDGNFSDAKIAGVEIIHHGVRTATNGDVRLAPTPEQWDAAPTLRERQVRQNLRAIDTELSYPAHGFDYTLRVQAVDDGVLLSVILERPLPAALEGRAGLNLEFLPSAYFAKSWMVDEHSGQFPLHPTGPTGRSATGEIERRPIATGRRIVLAPEDPERRIAVAVRRGGTLSLFDGRNQAQNGWFVVRTLLPAQQTGPVVEWHVTASAIADWTRPPVIGHSQVGYLPQQPKVAVLESDPNAVPPTRVRLLRVQADGRVVERLAGKPVRWGSYLRYEYQVFDFTEVREPGVYLLEAGGVQTKAFRIGPDVLDHAWQATLDVFFPVQMDHMFVNEAYRVWHGASHLDDARQAPVDHIHFDLYAQGPTTDTLYQPGEHIPGLNIGGWYDAGDFDIRTQTHYAVVQSLVQTWEMFCPKRDETTVNQDVGHVEIHQPDGVPDLLQQIEHGTLALIVQHRAVGHAIPGIVASDLGQYTHLGDGSTKTDNQIDAADEPAWEPGEARRPVADDRWAFTTRTTALNYGSAAALAAASRALRGYRDALAEECFATALRVWDEEHSREPSLFRHGNTTGGLPDDEELKAAVELLIGTGEDRFARRVIELWPAIEARFGFNAVHVLRVLPRMDAAFAAKVRARAMAYREEIAAELKEHPFGVPITRGGWAGNGRVVGFAITNYHLHRAFPELFDPTPTWRGLEFLHGCHPGSDISFISGVGAHSKTVAYGNNRADFSFIAGGVVPGVLILKPDFPENKEDWPFFWGENEYVIGLGASYLFLVHAAIDLAGNAPSH